MSNSSLLFPDVFEQLNEMYEFISRVATDVIKLKRKLSYRELQKLVADFKRGVEAVNIICIKIGAKYEVAKRTNKEIHVASEERNDIERKIATLTDELNRIVESDPMSKFLGEHPKLAEKAYIKLYGEGVDDSELPDKKSEKELEQEFLSWINAIKYFTGELLSELEEAIKRSF